MTQEERLMKAEESRAYKNLKKEHDDYVLKASRFAHKTYDLLHLIGMSDEEIFKYYRKENR